MTATAVVEVRDWVHERLAAATLLAGEKSYNDGQVPENAGIPRAIVGTASEPEGRRYQSQDGRDQGLQIRLWARNKAEAGRCYQEVFALLDQQLAALDGHQLVQCSLAYVTDSPTTPPGAHVVVAQLRTRTLAG